MMYIYDIFIRVINVACKFIPLEIAQNDSRPTQFYVAQIFPYMYKSVGAGIPQSV